MTDEEINELHKTEFADAVEQFGGVFKIPREVVAEIQERTRVRFVSWISARTERPDDEIIRHDRTDRLSKWIKTMVGKEVSVQSMMEATECSRGTASRYLLNNRSEFVKLAKGTYRVIDARAERAAVSARVVAAPALNPVPDHVAAVNAVNDAVARMTGASGGRTFRQPGKV